MDRTLDLAGTVVSAGGESVLSNMLQAHQPLEGHTFGTYIINIIHIMLLSLMIKDISHHYVIQMKNINNN